MNKIVFRLLGVGLLGLGGLAHGALINAGNGLIKDTTRNLVWTEDANLAETVDFGVLGINGDGTMTWHTAMAWIAAMNAASYKGYSDWRLPATLQPDATCSDQDGSGQDYGYDCTGSDLGHLYYTEGLLSAGDAITSSAVLSGLFTNMEDSTYWSGTQSAVYTDVAWYFGTYDGSQDSTGKDEAYYGWAVRPGQTAAAPLPATGFLVALGLIALRANRSGRRATFALR